MNTEKLQLTINAAQKAIELYHAASLNQGIEDIGEIDNASETALQRWTEMLEGDNPNKAKKIISIALMLASKAGAITLEPTAVVTASMSDEIVERIRVAAQVGKALLDPEEAISRLVDCAAVRMMVVADRVIEKGLPIVAEKIVLVIERVYPPASVLAPVIRTVVQMTTPIVKEYAHKGIRFMAESTKHIIKTGIKQVRVAISRVREALA